MTDDKRAPDVELLKAHHRFPGSFEVKAFGPSTPEFRQSVLSAVNGVHGVAEAEVARENRTRSGDRCSLTVRLQAETAEVVLEVYDRLHEVHGLTLLL